MATLVCFHAHPDDEAIATGGTMAKAVAAGHRVVLVLATRGEEGEQVPGVVPEGIELGAWREQETRDSAALLGCHRVVFLGYRDSGMAGAAANDAPESFWQADEFEAARRLAGILATEGAELLTIYDSHGVYGHPDHVAVHRVGTRAAELAGVPRVFWATMNRDRAREMVEAAARAGTPLDAERTERTDSEEFGLPDAEITHAIDVGEVLERKRAAMAAHASQIPPDSFFLALGEEDFAAAFGTEWFVRPGQVRTGPQASDLFA
ncbi:MAG: PIG-L family deacetylase [bacterium]|nr:PIG-L family deacetylase [bacterium]MDE0668619.1 PIG-L family deacetylase [bacterium]MXZ30013.1 GlcNAc-PI de-N-acetylase [Acidimicrobiia bacterium]MYB24989.1 GlcNAc-PI de-N-acetylase [Acidimicrobiia bacterium]MYJ14866.1 GlcNAc-PI de-N-acetylase [Acidimicrobiia bacterium]